MNRKPKATQCYEALHQLSQPQMLALDALASGATQAAAAQAAGVHRVTVTRWVLHHPEFKAELTRRRVDAAEEASALVTRVTAAALAKVEEAITTGDLDAALKWLRIAPLSTVTSTPSGPLFADDVVEGVRQSMPDDLEMVLQTSTCRTTSEAEELILTLLAE